MAALSWRLGVVLVALALASAAGVPLAEERDVPGVVGPGHRAEHGYPDAAVGHRRPEPELGADELEIDPIHQQPEEEEEGEEAGEGADGADERPARLGRHPDPEDGDEGHPARKDGGEPEVELGAEGRPDNFRRRGRERLRKDEPRNGDGEVADVFGADGAADGVDVAERVKELKRLKKGPSDKVAERLSRLAELKNSKPKPRAKQRAKAPQAPKPREELVWEEDGGFAGSRVDKRRAPRGSDLRGSPRNASAANATTTAAPKRIQDYNIEEMAQLLGGEAAAGAARKSAAKDPYTLFYGAAAQPDISVADPRPTEPTGPEKCECPPGPFKLMDFVFDALRGEVPCTKPRHKDKDGPASALHDRLKVVLKECHSILHVGMVELAAKSARGSGASVVALDWPENVANFTRKAHISDYPNLYIAPTYPDDLPALFSRLHQNPQAFFDAIVISDLRVLTRALLPHEFTSVLASAMTQAEHLLVVTESDVGDKLKEAAKLAGVSGRISEVTSSSWGSAAVARHVRVTDSTRTLEARECTLAGLSMPRPAAPAPSSSHHRSKKAAAGPPRCSLKYTHFSNETLRYTNLTLTVGDHRPVDVRRVHGIQLPVLLEFPLEAQTTGLLLEQLLQTEGVDDFVEEFSVALPQSSMSVYRGRVVGAAETEVALLNGTFTFRGPLYSRHLTKRLRNYDAGEPQLGNKTRRDAARNIPRRAALKPSKPSEQSFDNHWPQISRSMIADGPRPEDSFSVMTYGHHEVLLGLKTAQKFPQSNVLAVSSSFSSRVATHKNIASKLKLGNLMVMSTELTPALAASLHNMPEVFRYQILGIEIYRHLTAEGFVASLGRVLSLAQTSFLEVVDPKHLDLAAFLMSGRTGGFAAEHNVFLGFVATALEFAGVDEYTLTLLPMDEGANPAMSGQRVLRIDVKQMTRTVTTDCDGHTMTLRNNGDVVTLEEGGGADVDTHVLSRATSSISFQFLLQLGLSKEQRARFFGNYLLLPLHADMCPAHIVWSGGKLAFSSLDTSNVVENEHTLNRTEAQATLFASELQLPFSFLEYGSREGNLSIQVARAFPSASIISIEPNRELAHRHWEKIKAAKGPFNNIIGHHAADNSLAGKLFESPEFLRYQFMSWEQLQFLLGSSMRSSVDRFLGNMIGTGVTSFFELPSAEMLSLAFATLYPHVPCLAVAGPHRFLSTSHPTELFAHAEKRMVAESAKFTQDNNITVAAQTLSPVSGFGQSSSWRLLRVDVRNMSVQVNHHFDYSLDGHSRKYQLHCETNATDAQVYLVRSHDGFRIPYERVESMTLIALLRMGLLSEIKDRFYSLFINLPIFEDMAPWNIVFRGGTLDYIDYDTKDQPLDKIVPFAYQVMAVLMNYERTVNDFGKCNGHGENPYSIPFVSHCVGRQAKKCTDPRFPVSCADHTCRPTYIECLRSLSNKDKALEAKRQLRRDLANTEPLVDPVFEENPSRWVFDHGGRREPEDAGPGR